MAWMNPITDRNQTDIEYLRTLTALTWAEMTDQQRADWNNGLKGAFNLSDMERIKNNIQLLADVLELDITVGPIPEIYPTPEYLNQILAYVESIRNAYAIYDNTPATPAKLNTFQELNAVEQILFDVYSIIMANFKNYTGELYTGELVGLPC